MPDDIGKALLEYSIYFLFAASLIGNIVQYFVARRDERKRVLQQRRYEVYTEYLSKLDRTNERLSLAQNSEASRDKMQSFLGRLGSASPEHHQQLKDEYSQLMREQMELLLDWRTEVRALSYEANKARLLASDKTEQLIVELEEALSSTLAL